MNFFRTLFSTVYSPSFYAGVLTQTTGQAIKYFLKLSVILLALLVVSGWGVVDALVKFQRDAPKYLDQVASYFPDDLLVTIKDGKASTTAKEPYVIKAPEDLSEGADFNLVVVDTKTPFSMEKFKEFNTFAWLTSDSLVYYGKVDSSNKGPGGGADIRVTSLSEFPDTVIDRAYVRDLLNKILPWLLWLVPLGGILLLLAVYIGIWFKLVYVLILALLVMLLVKILGQTLNYGQSYRVALYAASAGFVASGVAGALHYPVPVFAVTVLSLIIVLINFAGQPKTQAR